MNLTITTVDGHGIEVKNEKTNECLNTTLREVAEVSHVPQETWKNWPEQTVALYDAVEEWYANSVSENPI